MGKPDEVVDSVGDCLFTDPSCVTACPIEQTARDRVASLVGSDGITGVIPQFGQIENGNALCSVNFIPSSPDSSPSLLTFINPASGLLTLGFMGAIERPDEGIEIVTTFPGATGETASACAMFLGCPFP